MSTVRVSGMYAPVHGVLRPRRGGSAEPPIPDELRTELHGGHPVTFVVVPDLDEDPGPVTGDLAVELRHDGVRVARDDDGAGSGEREVAFTPDHSGTFVIRVSAPAARGVAVRYTLWMYPGESGLHTARER